MNTQGISDLKAATLIILATAFILVLFSSCDSSGSAAVMTLSQEVTSDPAPVPSPSPSASPAENYSVLKNWGWMDQAMPLNFQTVRTSLLMIFSSPGLNQVPLRIFWNQYSNPTEFGIDGREYRTCRAFLTISGDGETGTITISQSEISWSQDTRETASFNSCPTDPIGGSGNVDGVYPYTVDVTGFSFNGSVYQEIL